MQKLMSAGLLLVLVALLGGQPALARDRSDTNWVATWATASKTRTPFDRALPVQTLLQVRVVI